MTRVTSSGRGIVNDLSASVVVFLVALPLCLGIGLASTGRPDLVFAGIISGIVGGIVVGFVSGSHIGVSGPAAGLVVIVLTAIETLGSFEAIMLATVIAGILQLIGGYLRAGIIGYYFPSSVIKGMLAAIGLTLILKEIPHALGYDKDYMGNQAILQPGGESAFEGITHAFAAISPGAVVISIVSLMLLILFERPFFRNYAVFRFLPGALFVVVIGILLNAFYGSVIPGWQLTDEHLVQLPVATDAASFIGFFRLPDFSALTNPTLYVVAGTIALVASLETLLCVEATDKLDPLKRTTPTNRELKAQGVGNIVAGMIGGLPITQVIVRSSANVTAGGRTKVSAIMHGFILLLAAVAIPRLLNLIPLASLAAVLLMVGYKLSKPELYRGMFRLGHEQFLPFIATIVGVLLTDLLRGIAIGMAVAIFYILRKNYKHSYHLRQEKEAQRQVITIELSEEVTFLNKASIQDRLERVPDNSRVIIDGRRSQHIDHDVLEIIHDFRAHGARLRNIEVETLGIDSALINS